MACDGPHVPEWKIKQIREEFTKILIYKYHITQEGKGMFFKKDLDKAWQDFYKSIEELVTMDAYDGF